MLMHWAGGKARGNSGGKGQRLLAWKLCWKYVLQPLAPVPSTSLGSQPWGLTGAPPEALPVKCHWAEGLKGYTVGGEELFSSWRGAWVCRLTLVARFCVEQGVGSLWLGLCPEARQPCPSHRAQREWTGGCWHWADGNDLHALNGRTLGAVHDCPLIHCMR